MASQCSLRSVAPHQQTSPVITPLQVYTEGRLIVEFNFDDLMRIRSWHFAIRNHRELIPRSVIAMQVRSDPERVTFLILSLLGARNGGDAV